MICVSIQEPGYQEILNQLKSLSFAEIRLDHLNLSEEQLCHIFSTPISLIATMREGQFTEERRIETLLTAIQAGASYVDVELESSTYMKNRIRQATQNKNSDCQLIISFHDFNATPSRTELQQIVQNCFDAGADIVKVACMANSKSDCVRLLSLLEEERPLIVIGMGPVGQITRVVGPLLGCPFTYASVSSERKTASGQLSVDRMKVLLDVIQSEIVC